MAAVFPARLSVKPWRYDPRRRSASATNKTVAVSEQATVARYTMRTPELSSAKRSWNGSVSKNPAAVRKPLATDPQVSSSRAEASSREAISV